MQAERAPDPDSIPSRMRDVTLAFPGSPMAVRRTLAAVSEALSTLRLSDEEHGTVELVLAEALNNVVEHAYGGRAAGWVQLTCRHRDAGIVVTIRDRGDPMPRDRAPLADLADGRRSLVDMPEGGFGWFIIRDLARDIAYRRADDTNELTFRIAVAQL